MPPFFSFSFNTLLNGAHYYVSMARKRDEYYCSILEL